MTIDLNGREVAVWAFGNEAMEQASVAGGGWDRLEELLPEVLAWGEANFGTYQPDAAGYVIAPLEIGWSLEIMGRPVFTWAFSDIVFVHEYMHQWAGNSVTVADWSDLWLAEGFATYAEWLWTEDHGGMTALERAETYWSGLADTSALWSVAVAHPTREQLWGTWNYQGGALALTALRAGVGDAVFDQIVRDWFATYANSNASTDDFVALAEQVSGRDLSSWRATWLDTTGKPAAWPDTTTYPVDNPYASLYAFFHRLVALIHKLVASLQGIGQ
jgi:hypothetical protein